jgi:hypothetical protein
VELEILLKNRIQNWIPSSILVWNQNWNRAMLS